MAVAAEHAGDVLLADDAAAGRGLLTGLVEQLGYAPLAVASGAAAVELLAADPLRFGLALIDVDMPGMDGLAAARAIATLAGPPPVVGLTAAGKPEEEARARAAGMAATLRKPVRREALAEALDRWFREPPGAPPPIDFAHLARYTLADAALERELFALFRGNAESYLGQMAVAAGDEPWRRAAHALKGAARGIGATGVAAVAEAAEALVGPASDSAARAAALRRLRASVAALRRAVHPDRLARPPVAPHNAGV